MERTLIMIKGDAVQRRLVGRIIRRFEDKGLKIVGLKMLRLSEQTARRLYAEHEGRDFFTSLVSFIISSPVVVMAIEGAGAVAACRKLAGATSCSQADAGTIRGDFGMSDRHNLVHCSDSQKSAKREMELLFNPAELVEYDLADTAWVYSFQGEQVV